MSSIPTLNNTPSQTRKPDDSCRICGFTITEMLVTLMIVTLLTSAIATGVAFAQRHYHKTIMVSESKVLYSTLENVLRNELSYAEIVVVQNGEVLFTSHNYSASAYDSNAGEYAKCWRVGVDPSGATRGHLALVRSGSPNQLLISESAYTYDMTASVTVTAPGNSYIHVVLSIYDKNGNALIDRQPFDVKPLNATIATAAAGS